MSSPPSTFREAERRFRACSSVAEACARGALDPRAPAPAGAGACGGEGVIELRPGLFVLPAFLCAREQRALALLCLACWAQPPHRTNAGALGEAAEDAAEEAAAAATAAAAVSAATAAEAAAPALAPAPASAPTPEPEPEPDGALLLEYGAAEAEAAEADAAGDAAAKQRGHAPRRRARARLLGLSWSCLGLHYDWTHRAYHLAGDADFAAASRGGARPWRSPLPPQVAALCTRVLGAARGEGAGAAIDGNDGTRNDGGGGGGARPASAPHLRMHPDAAIVNFYAATAGAGARARGGASKLPMGAHRDDLERSLAPPVVSVSLGRAAVFLVQTGAAAGVDAAAGAGAAAAGAAVGVGSGSDAGAPDAGAASGAAPLALLLRSGDAVVLSGPARLALHGVAAVFAEAEAGDAWAEDGDGEGAGDGDGEGAGDGDKAGAGDGDEGETAGGGLGGEGGRALRAAAARYMRSHRVNVNARQCCA